MCVLDRGQVELGSEGTLLRNQSLAVAANCFEQLSCSFKGSRYSFEILVNSNSRQTYFLISGCVYFKKVLNLATLAVIIFSVLTVTVPLVVLSLLTGKLVSSLAYWPLNFQNSFGSFTVRNFQKTKSEDNSGIVTRVLRNFSSRYIFLLRYFSSNFVVFPFFVMGGIGFPG